MYREDSMPKYERGNPQLQDQEDKVFVKHFLTKLKINFSYCSLSAIAQN